MCSYTSTDVSTALRPRHRQHMRQPHSQITATCTLDRMMSPGALIWLLMACAHHFSTCMTPTAILQPRAQRMAASLWPVDEDGPPAGQQHSTWCLCSACQHMCTGTVTLNFQLASSACRKLQPRDGSHLCSIPAVPSAVEQPAAVVVASAASTVCLVYTPLCCHPITACSLIGTNTRHRICCCGRVQAHLTQHCSHPTCQLGDAGPTSPSAVQAAMSIMRLSVMGLSG
jgi:hypothetical protein